MTFINSKWIAIALLLVNIPLSARADEKKLDLFEVVKATLDNSPVLKIQGFQVDVAKATARIKSGAFNVNTSMKVSNDSTKNTLYVPGETYAPVATPRPPVPPTVLGASDADTQNFQASASKKTRSGITTKLQFDLNRRDPSGISTTPTDYFYGTTNRGKVGLTITVPLLKGAWEVSSGAAEKSAGLDYQSAAADYKQLITKTLLDTIKAYWGYTAANEILNQRIIIKGRIEQLTASNPSNEFLRGFLQEKQGKVVTETQNLEQARISLARVMGIPVDDALKLGTPDATNFPTNPENLLQQFDAKNAKHEWVELALNNRNDLRSAKLDVESKDILLAGDKQDLYPELTAAVGVGYNGISHGNGFDNYVDSSYRHVRDFDHNASLVFSYPIGNDAAEGAYDRDHAQKMAKIVTMNETARGIKLSIENSVAIVHGRLKVLVQSQKTRDSYRDSLLDLFKKSNLTNAEDVSNIIVLQQKLEDAIVAYVNAQADYANAVAQARFETGVLISNADNSDLNADINIDKVSSLPSLAQQ